jgi:hypothetical protein
VTPPTVQGTAFEKDRGADARPIVNGELFYVKDHSFDQNSFLCLVARRLPSVTYIIKLLVYHDN